MEDLLEEDLLEEAHLPVARDIDLLNSVAFRDDRKNNRIPHLNKKHLGHHDTHHNSFQRTLVFLRNGQTLVHKRNLLHILYDKLYLVYCNTMTHKSLILSNKQRFHDYLHYNTDHMCSQKYENNRRDMANHQTDKFLFLNN